jgi:hypothetical protein
MNPDDYEMQAMMEEHSRLHAENMERMEQERIVQDAQYRLMAQQAQLQMQEARYGRQQMRQDMSGLTFSDFDMESIKERLLEAALKKDVV